MFFLDPSHQAFYEQAIIAEQAENNPSRKALFYCLGLMEETRYHISDLYNFTRHTTKDSGLWAKWQTRDTRKVCNLAFNLYNGYTGRNSLYVMDFTPWRIFDSPLRPYLFQAIDIRFGEKPTIKEESK